MSILDNNFNDTLDEKAVRIEEETQACRVLAAKIYKSLLKFKPHIRQCQRDIDKYPNGSAGRMDAKNRYDDVTRKSFLIKFHAINGCRCETRKFTVHLTAYADDEEMESMIFATLEKVHKESPVNLSEFRIDKHFQICNYEFTR